MLTRVLGDYNNAKVSADAWIASTRRRLREADKTLSGLRQHTAAISDSQVAAQLRLHDRLRTQTLTAFNRLLGSVTSGSGEREAQQLVNRRLRAYQRQSRRLLDLMEPYLTDEQRQFVDQAGGA